MRKRSIVSSLILLASVLALPQAFASTPKPGGICPKSGAISTVANIKFTCIKSGKKLVWNNGVKVIARPTPTVTPSSSSKPEATYYVAKDQMTVRTLNASEACSNPQNASFEIQAKVGETWLPVRTIEGGYKPSSNCTNPGLGKRNDLAWATVYMDEGTTYRWVFSGEINFEFRDALGRGISKVSEIPISLFPKVHQDQTQVPLITLTSSAKRALTNPQPGIPIFDARNKVTISNVGQQTLSNFVAAVTKEKFTYIGPKPLVETASDRSGAVSLITQSGQKTYQSTSAIPPWGVSFNLKLTDPQGRFLVTTSAVGNNGFGNNSQSSWRLAYKGANGTWQYQSIAGSLHPTDNVKYFDQVSLGAPGNYSIKLEFQWNTTFYGVGINEDPKYLTQPQEDKPLNVMIIGDSWTYPIITDSLPFAPWDGYPLALSWLTGWNVMAAGVPGQGYLQKASGETYRERVIRDVAPQDPEVVIFTGSPNDHCQNCSFSDKEIAIEAGNDIQLLAKAYPQALVVLCSPFTPSPSQNSEMKAVAQSLGIPYIDFAKMNLFTQANNGQHELLDGHPTRAGGAYIAAELLKAIAALP